MNTETPNTIADLFKQISDEFNKGVEQAKRIKECKMRRFFMPSNRGRGTSRHDGAVFPSGHVVVYDNHYSNLQIFSNLDAYTDYYRASGIQWVDPEPVGWHFDPDEASK